MLCRTARHYRQGTVGAITTRPSHSLAGRTLHASPSISSPSSIALGLGDRWCCHNTPSLPPASKTLHDSPSIRSPLSTTLGLGDSWCCHNTPVLLRLSNIARRSKISSLSLFILLSTPHGFTSHYSLRLALCRALHLDWGDGRSIVSKFCKVFDFLLLLLLILFYMKWILTS